MAESTAQTSNQVDLLGESLIGDLMDTPASAPAEISTMNGNSSEADLFADATFVSAPPQAENAASASSQVNYVFLLLYSIHAQRTVIHKSISWILIHHICSTCYSKWKNLISRINYHLAGNFWKVRWTFI